MDSANNSHGSPNENVVIIVNKRKGHKNTADNKDGGPGVDEVEVEDVRFAGPTEREPWKAATISTSVIPSLSSLSSSSSTYLACVSSASSSSSTSRKAAATACQDCRLTMFDDMSTAPRGLPKVIFKTAKTTTSEWKSGIYAFLGKRDAFLSCGGVGYAFDDLPVGEHDHYDGDIDTDTDTDIDVDVDNDIEDDVNDKVDGEIRRRDPRVADLPRKYHCPRREWRELPPVSLVGTGVSSWDAPGTKTTAASTATATTSTETATRILVPLCSSTSSNADSAPSDPFPLKKTTATIAPPPLNPLGWTVATIDPNASNIDDGYYCPADVPLF